MKQGPKVGRNPASNVISQPCLWYYYFRCENGKTMLERKGNVINYSSYSEWTPCMYACMHAGIQTDHTQKQPRYHSLLEKKCLTYEDSMCQCNHLDSLCLCMEDVLPYSLFKDSLWNTGLLVFQPESNPLTHGWKLKKKKQVNFNDAPMGYISYSNFVMIIKFTEAII